MILAAAITCASVSSAQPTWQAGVAKIDITPTESMWLAGYAARDKPSEGVLHPLWVKALALQDAEGKRAVLITADHLGIPKQMSEVIRNRIKENLGLERAQIILSGSHTHSGPVLDDSLMCIYPAGDADIEKIKKYSRWLEAQTVTVAEQAFSNLTPVQLASANGVTRFAVNRRNNKEAEILSTHEFKGPVDHAVPVIKVSKADGGLLAVVFGYACHNTTLCDQFFCGDYAGFAQIELETQHPGATALFFAGCGADQNPMPRRTVALAQQYGCELASAVDRAMTDPMQTLDPVFRTEYLETELALETPPTREQLEAMLPGAAPYLKKGIEKFIHELDAGKPLQNSYMYPVQIWKMGAQPLVVLGGETVVDYTILIKQLLGRDVFVMTYANDVCSYIPSVRVLKEGGYEGGGAQILYGLPSVWKDDVEARILTVVRELAQKAGVEVKLTELPSTASPK